MKHNRKERSCIFFYFFEQKVDFNFTPSILPPLPPKNKKKKKEKKKRHRVECKSKKVVQFIRKAFLSFLCGDIFRVAYEAPKV